MTVHYSPPVVNAIGYGQIAYASLASGFWWLVAQASPVGPGTAEAASQAGSNAGWFALTGVLTLVVNQLFAYLKSRSDANLRDVATRAEYARKLDDLAAVNDRKMADATAEAARLVKDAKAEADRKLADAKAESDRQHAAAELDRQRWADDAARAADRHKKLREFENAELLKLQDEVRELRKAAGQTTPRVDRNSVAADILADAAKVPIPPDPSPPA